MSFEVVCVCVYLLERQRASHYLSKYVMRVYSTDCSRYQPQILKS